MKQDVNVIYLDNHLLVLNKQPGLATQNDSVLKCSLEERAKSYVKECYKKPGAVFLNPIHRLDKPVSGLVLFARTSKALTRLQEAQKNRHFSKYYVAIVEGHLTEKQTELKHFIVHEEFHAQVYDMPVPLSKACLLKYRVLKENTRNSLILIALHTGRYHQIRAQFAQMGHPILGDFKYGSQKKSPNECIALHHFQLEICHPVTKEMFLWQAPFFENWLEKDKLPLGEKLSFD